MRTSANWTTLSFTSVSTVSIRTTRRTLTSWWFRGFDRLNRVIVTRGSGTPIQGTNRRGWKCVKVSVEVRRKMFCNSLWGLCLQVWRSQYWLDFFNVTKTVTIYSIKAVKIRYFSDCLCAGQIVLPPSPLPGQPRGQKKNVCDKKGRGTGKKRVIRVFREGQGKNKVIRTPGQPKKSDVPGDARGDGGRTIRPAHYWNTSD